MAWVKDQWAKEPVRCLALFGGILAHNLATFWFLYHRLRTKTEHWPDDRAAAIPGPPKCADNFPDQTALCGRLVEQYDLVVVRARFHADLFSHYIAEHFASLALAFFSSILAAACAAYIARKGWENTHAYATTTFVAFSLSLAFFGGYPQLARHEDNVKDNEFLFLEHGNLANEIRSFASGSRVEGRDLAEFVQHVDGRLRAMNRIPLEFDAGAVSLGSTKFMEAQELAN